LVNPPGNTKAGYCTGGLDTPDPDDHTLRQVVGLDLVVDGHLAELTRHPPCPPMARFSRPS